MKITSFTYTICLCVFLLISSCDNAVKTSEVSAKKEEDVQSTSFDSIKASQYGADQYGMKKYVMAFLKRGPNKSLDSVKRMELQRAHMDNIGRLAKKGKLVLAGPFLGNEDLRGIYIFNVSTIEEAEALTNTDPSIQAGVLEMELKEWYGSAALMEVNDIHTTLSKEDI